MLLTAATILCVIISREGAGFQTRFISTNERDIMTFLRKTIF
jgi:hypothetical protein